MESKSLNTIEVKDPKHGGHYLIRSPLYEGPLAMYGRLGYRRTNGEIIDFGPYNDNGFHKDMEGFMKEFIRASQKHLDDVHKPTEEE